MNVSGIRYSGGSQRCRYMFNGECQLFSAKCEDDKGIMPEYVERLLHIVNCLEEIRSRQSEVIEDLFKLAMMHLSADCEEVKTITAKINEIAKINAEV